MQAHNHTNFRGCPLFTQAEGDSETRSQRASRLWNQDTSLWTDDPSTQGTIANRLGWLTSAAWLSDRLPEIDRVAKAVADDGIKHIVLLGMGGSSLAPEVIDTVYQGTQLTMLDNTSVEAVQRVRQSCDPATTLYIVSSKSGGTIETMAFAHYFMQEVAATLKDTASRMGNHFITVTDPGSPLQAFAESNHFRHVFENPADIGGRYSALSFFGAVPCVMAGVKVDRLVQLAVERQMACQQGDDDLAMRLGTALGHFAMHGRDKLTLTFGQSVEPLGPWIEQLVAESTGKQGKGIVPVLSASLDSPDHYGDDRVFIHTSIAGEDTPTAALDALQAAGHPVLHWTLPDKDHIGAAFLDWEIATALSGVVLNVNPFDEPNVTESKQATQAVLNSAATDDSQERQSMVSVNDIRSLLSALQSTLASVNAGDYIGLLAYLDVDTQAQAQLDRIMASLNKASKAAVTLGIGPRFLHSTGQLHKGGANTGVFIQLVGNASTDIAIPTMSMGFARLNSAQAEGDLNVLMTRKRRACAINLGDDCHAGLAALATAIDAL